MYVSALLGIAALATQAYGHGYVTSPQARAPGAATKEACGEALVKGINSDPTTYVEALNRVVPSDKGYHPEKCNLYLCKGVQFADNSANIQSYKPGDTVNLKVNLRIPHKGWANVSVVDTASNAAIGKPLYTWAKYADEKEKSRPADETDFKITIPDLGGKCTQAGQCVSNTDFIRRWRISRANPTTCRSSNGTGSALRRPMSLASISPFRARPPGDE